MYTIKTREGQHTPGTVEEGGGRCRQHCVGHVDPAMGTRVFIINIIGHAMALAQAGRGGLAGT